MEKGSLRCDANVSVRASETAPFGTRVEIKNLNSIRFVAKAIEHEIERQGEALARGEKIVQQTRLWDEKAGRTVAMRSKEEAHDYRYFPEPDLGLLVVDEAWIAEAAGAMPELPRARRRRFVEAIRPLAPGRGDARVGPPARRLLRADRGGRAAEARGQLGDGRGPALDEGAQDLDRGRARVSGLARAPGRAGPPDRGGRGFDGLRQGSARRHARFAGRGFRDRRREGPRQHPRHGRARGGRRRGRRGQSVAGRALPRGQDADLRLARRAGHEEDRAAARIRPRCARR